MSCRRIVLLLVCAALATAAGAQQPSSPPAAERPTTAPSEEPPAELAPVEELLVVTASRSEQRLHEVPATVTVLTSEQIEALPADDYGDLLRNVPGLNVAQMSARDVQITGRSATTSIATTELVLVDGRSVYLDFLGFVLWDYVPTNPREIRQIEVVRGPASAVWGANAMTGVINVITKAPKDMQGTSLALGAGELGTRSASLLHAGVAGRLGYKVSGSYYEQDPYPRPQGNVPGTDTPYPEFENQGTSQPKGDLRFDFDQSAQTRFSVSSGWAGTDGIIYSPIGPFDIQTGSSLSYVKLGWTRGALELTGFVNVLDGEASNLLTVSANGRPLLLAFSSDTYDVDLGHSLLVGGRNLITYGANARRNQFDLSIAPLGTDRDEKGVFVQDELLLGKKVRWLVGVRGDDIDPIGQVFSPRTTLILAPVLNHTFRLSYNRAFRAPALIENYLDIDIGTTIELPFVGPFTFETRALGNPQLEEQKLDAYEVGYVGTFDRRGSSVSLAAYRNELRGSVDFFPVAFYDSSNPPAGWPFPAEVFDLPQLRDVLPSRYGFRNVGEIVDRGVELALDHRLSKLWSWFLSYSYQEPPTVRGIPEDQVNIPPRSRLNVGWSYAGRRWFGGANVNYASEAFWTDVLDDRYHGPTDAYTMTNASLGVRLAHDRVTLSITAQNLFDERVQQHVFGDLIVRKITGQVRFDFR